MTTTTSTTAGARPNTREMVVVHNVFRRMFGDLPGLVRATRPGDTERAAVLADAYTELAWGLHHHHTGEDELLWPTLMQRVDADNVLVLRAEEQHQRVHELTERANELVAAYRVSASASSRDAFATTVEELNAALCEHMADEERFILPLVEQHLTVAEWERLGERARAGTPKDRLLIHLGWILEDLPAADRQEFLGHLPLPARIAWRLVGRRKFKAERRAIYGE
jgi:iron-sulfur cluster repair protein YtfE (RIC family)